MREDSRSSVPEGLVEKADVDKNITDESPILISYVLQKGGLCMRARSRGALNAVRWSWTARIWRDE